MSESRRDHDDHEHVLEGDNEAGRAVLAFAESFWDAVRTATEAYVVNTGDPGDLTTLPGSWGDLDIDQQLRWTDAIKHMVPRYITAQQIVLSRAGQL